MVKFPVLWLLLLSAVFVVYVPLCSTQFLLLIMKSFSTHWYGVVIFRYICLESLFCVSNKTSWNSVSFPLAFAFRNAGALLALFICAIVIVSAHVVMVHFIALFFWLQSSRNREIVKRFVSRGDHNEYHSGAGAELFSSADSPVSCKPPGGDHMACSWWLRSK